MTYLICNEMYQQILRFLGFHLRLLKVLLYNKQFSKPNTTPISYSGNFNLFNSGTYFNAMECNIDDELRNIAAWFKDDTLSLNIEKWKRNISWRNNEQVTSEGKKQKFFRRKLDKNIHWSDHTNYIACIVSCGIGIILEAEKYIK